MRSMQKVFTENSVLQIDQGNLISRPAWLKVTICLKTSELSKFTIDQGNLMSVTAQVHTQCKNKMLLKYPGLPHSTVKQLYGASVRELIQKIRNHPHRHVLQRDVQQSQSFNPFSQESKDMFREVGNIELCELLDTEPKAQCKVCLSYWVVGIVYCTCGLFLKRIFDISSKLVGEQEEEIFNVDKIHWEKHSWKHLSLIGVETVINLQRVKVFGPSGISSQDSQRCSSVIKSIIY